MRVPRFFIALMGIAQLLFASPPAKASATIADKRITIKYGAPSIRGRQIFGEAGLLSKDWTYPVWRAGANPEDVHLPRFACRCDEGRIGSH